MSAPFFNEQTSQSRVKATIVAKYFVQWAKIMINVQKSNEQRYGRSEGRIAYIDLFAGPGRYEQGEKSTPLLVLEKAIADEAIRTRLITIFNDKDERNIRSLKEEFENLPNIHLLKYAPRIMHQEIGTEIVKMFEQMRLVPTLFFVDPFGYKGLSLRLINSVLQNWGCDCIFFFNYNRINMGLNNEAVKEHMIALFGEETANVLSQQLAGMKSVERELTIVEALAQALKKMGGQYVLPFGFKNEQGTRTTHHLIFVSKDFKGYEVMKEVMAKESSENTQGVASFQYNQASERQPLLFELSRPLDDLGQILLEEFAGKTLPMLDVYLQHNVGTPFIKKNYKDVLQNLEEAHQIVVPKHKKGTFADHLPVTFPSLSTID